MLSETQWQEITEGVAASEYSLLIGAGISMSALSRYGEALPDASTLAQLISQQFQLPEETTDLRMAYEAAQYSKTRDGFDRENFLSDLLRDTQPTWHNIIANFRWKSIWTLNIDDVIENSYKMSSDKKQNLVCLCWNSGSYNSSDSEVKIIHLHGFVNKPDIPRSSSQNYIFDNLQYVDASFSMYPWHSIFRSEFTRFPFLVIGTQLSYEFDLELALARGTSTFEQSGRRSYLIVKSITPLKQMMFSKRGITVIEYDAEDFFRDLYSRVRALEASRKTYRSDSAIKFLSQFRPLRIDSNLTFDGRHDIFKGDHPIWQDALDGKIVPLSLSDSVMSYISSNITKPTNSLIFLEGLAGTGKTAAIFDICLQLVRSKFEVFLFRKEEALDVPACLDFIRSRSKHPIIVVDGIGDFTDEFSHLVAGCEQEKVPLKLIYTERTSRNSRIKDSYLYARTDKIIETGRITSTDAAKIINRLKDFNRLGRLTPLSHKERLEHFTKHAKYQLFTGMYSIDYAKGFLSRIESEIEELSGVARDVYMLISIVYSLGYSLPIDALERLTGLNSRDVIDMSKDGGQLSGQIYIDYQGVVSRHRIISSQVIENVLDRQDLIDYVTRLLAVFSTYVNRNSIGSKNIYTLIFKSLMDAEILHDWLRNDAIKVYEHLSTYYSWSARFWEQRALLFNKLGLHSDSVNYAHKAVDLRKDSYTFNTLGTVTLDKAISLLKEDSETIAVGLFNEGINYLKESRDAFEFQNLHPYTTFFTKTIEASRHSSKISALIEPEFDSWLRLAKYHRILSRERLNEYEANYGRIRNMHRKSGTN